MSTSAGPASPAQSDDDLFNASTDEEANENPREVPLDLQREEEDIEYGSTSSDHSEAVIELSESDGDSDIEFVRSGRATPEPIDVDVEPEVTIVNEDLVIQVCFDADLVLLQVNTGRLHTMSVSVWLTLTHWNNITNN